MMTNMKVAALIGAVFLVASLVEVRGHNTPCNVNNDTFCLEGVRQEFVRTDYWFGNDYFNRCANGTANSDFACMNPDLNHTTIASRLLRTDGFNTSLIGQFLRIRFNTPKGSYIACGHQYDVDAYVMDLDLDNTHTIYLDSWIMGHRPRVTFDQSDGQVYTLVAYDAGYVRLGGLWVNIKTGDSATGEELYPYMGPVNPLYTLRNPFVFALFRQDGGLVTNVEGQKKAIVDQIKNNGGHYFLDSFIRDNHLEGPIGIGYIAFNTDAYSIQHFVDRNIYNNCPYLVSKQPEVLTALQVMGYPLTSTNSFADFRGSFLTSLQLDVSVTFYSPEAHFDSCCQHNMISPAEVTVDPVDSTPILPLYTRNPPYVTLSPIDMGDKMFAIGKLFTLFLLDVTDAVQNITSPNVIIHWQMVNIPGDSVERGDTVQSYLPPLPSNRTQVRTFMFLVLTQPSRVDPAALWSYTGANCDSKTALRCRFNLGAVLKYLRFRLVGLNVFRSQQDSFTRAVMYGVVDPRNVATSMAQFMNSPTPTLPADLTKAQACQGIAGFADPCPSGCSMDHNHGDSATTVASVSTTTTMMNMDMGHNHGRR